MLKIQIKFNFLRFHIHSMHFDWMRNRKKLKKTRENFRLSVQGPLLLITGQKYYLTPLNSPK